MKQRHFYQSKARDELRCEALVTTESMSIILMLRS